MKAKTRERIAALEQQVKESCASHARDTLIARASASKMRNRLLRAGLIDMSLLTKDIRWTMNTGQFPFVDCRLVLDPAGFDAFKEGINSVRPWEDSVKLRTGTPEYDAALARLITASRGKKPKKPEVSK